MALAGMGSPGMRILLAAALAGTAFSMREVPPGVGRARADRPCAEAVRRGDAERAGGDFERSLGSYGEALSISERAGDAIAGAECLAKLGLCEWNLGRVKEAETRFREAVERAGAFGPREVLSFSRGAMEIIRLYERGKERRLSNDLAASLDAFRRAVAIGRRIGGPEFVAKCLRQMTGTQWQMNDLKGFFAGNREGLEIATRLNLKIEQGRCLNNLGLYHWKTTDYSKALRCFQQALRISNEQQDIRMEAECLTNTGIIYKELGDYPIALSCFQKAYSIDKKTNAVAAIPIDLTNLGSINRDLASYNADRSYLDKALSYYQSCLSNLSGSEPTQIRISCLNNIGTIKTDLGLLSDAQVVLNAALKQAEGLGLNEEMASLNTNIGDTLYKLKKLDLAKAHFLNAISIALEFRINQVLWEAYFGLGKCLEMDGDPIGALASYQKSVDVIDSIRSRILLEAFKTGFSRNKIGIFESLLALLTRLYDESPSGSRLEEMFVVVEKAKARAFLECLGEVRIDPRDSLADDLREREEEVSREISDLIRALSRPGLEPAARDEALGRLERAEEESLRLVSEMKAELTERKGLFSPELLSIRGLQERFLDDRTGIIEYFLGDRRSYLFFVTRTQARLIGLPPREELERSLRGYLKALTVPDKEGFSGQIAAERLAREILPPLAGSPVDRLLVVPDGILYYLPFETLRPAGMGGSGYLIERYEISYAPSSSSFAFLTEKRSGPHRRTILAVGAPEPKAPRRPDGKGTPEMEGSAGEIYQGLGFDLGPLPFSRGEVLDIARHFPKATRDVLLGSRANERGFKALPLDDYGIVHFACHGLLDERVPFRSALVLSSGRGDEEDGFLQAREIYNLPMDADLVVLSACQTGKGRLEKGEGLLGLPRMFFYAGARSVVSSLWPVGDRSTAFLMDSFYDHLAGGEGKALALRHAKLEMLRSKYRHPFHWAAFLLNGDTGPIGGRGGALPRGRRDQRATTNQ